MFLAECPQQTSSLEKIRGQICFLDIAITAWKRDQSNVGMIGQSVRSIQAIRGICKARGLSEMESLTGNMETLLLKLRSGAVKPSDQVIHLVCRCSDALEAGVVAFEMGLPLPDQIEDVSADLQCFVAKAPVKAITPSVKSPFFVSYGA